MTTTTSTLAHLPFAAALEEHGWQFNADERGWSHPTPTGVANLVLLEERAEFQRLKLVGGPIAHSSNAKVLEENFQLPGLVKLVSRRSCAPLCRVDVPTELDSAMGERFVSAHDPLAAEPMTAWAEVATSGICGGPMPEAAPLDPQAALDSLQRQGWAGSVDDGELNIHMSVVGVFRKVRVEQGPAGIRIVADLADLSGYSKTSLRAALRLANEANARLPLVRLGIDREHKPQVVRAEVAWPAPNLPGAWLAAALEVVEAAVALAARELEAVRNAELANLVLAAPSGPNALMAERRSTCR